MRRVYLDYNATTPPDRLVMTVMEETQREIFGNPSSRHWHGQRARAVVEESRDRVARLLGCSPGEIVFTSGGTEASNLALWSVTRAVPGSRHKIAVSSIEHHAVLHCVQALARDGWLIEMIRAGSDGIVDLDDLRRRVDDQTVVLALMLANNETGVIQPVAQAAALAHDRGALVLCDAVQAIGKTTVNVGALGADFLSLSGHKFYGPKGIGALYVRNGVTLHPLMHGGGQEKDRRPGTENVAGIVGLGRAADLAEERLACDTSSISTLRDLLESRLSTIAGAAVNGSGPRIPNTTNIAFEGVDADSLAMALDLRGIAVSTGAACSNGAAQSSHVIRAMGFSIARAKYSLRFSLGRDTSQEEIEHTIRVVEETVAQQRRHRRDR